MSNLYDPSVTGLLLLFAGSWIFLAAISDGAENPPSLAEGIVWGGVVTAVVGVVVGILIGIISLVGSMIWYFIGVLRNANEQLSSPIELYRPAYDGFIFAMDWSIGLILGFLHWIPIEVAAVLFAMGFLMITTRDR